MGRSPLVCVRVFPHTPPPDGRRAVCLRGVVLRFAQSEVDTNSAHSKPTQFSALESRPGCSVQAHKHMHIDLINNILYQSNIYFSLMKNDEIVVSLSSPC